MSDIQRWTLPHDGYAFQSDDGGYVTYADHVAALLTQDQQHMEQQAAAEQRVRETNAVSCGVKRDRSGNVTACDGWHEGYEAGRRDEKAEVRNAGVAGARGFAAGIKAARDAVDAVWSAPDGLLRGLCNHADALAAIDGLANRGRDA